MIAARATRVQGPTRVGSGAVLIEADGEQPGRLPAAFRVLPGALLLAL